MGNKLIGKLRFSEGTNLAFSNQLPEFLFLLGVSQDLMWECLTHLGVAFQILDL